MTVSREDPKKTFCTEFVVNGRIFCNLVEAEDWDEANEQCADNEYVVGELMAVVPFYEC